MCLLRSEETKRQTVKVMCLLGLAFFISGCTSEKQTRDVPEPLGTTNLDAPDPPCTQAGYFPSNIPHTYYRCVWDPVAGRFLRYIFRCPGTQNFNPTTEKCE